MQGVVGLSTLTQPQPQIVLGSKSSGSASGGSGSQPAISPAPAASPAGACTAEASTGGYTAPQMAGTYGFNPLYGLGHGGTGQTVGIYELEPFTAGDVAAYQKCSGTNVSIATVPVDGGATAPQSGEAALDIETVAGLAPGASITVYSGLNAGNGPIDTYARMVDDDTAKVLTTSWGLCEPDMAQNGGEQSTESVLFAQAAAQGQTVVAASGDSGSTDCYNPPANSSTAVTVDDLADQPDVTGVGGTSLLAAGSTPDEVTWNDSFGSGGGGVSSDFAIPAWQSGPGVSSPAALTQCSAIPRTTCREVPDVSASSDPSHGYAFYFGGAWGVVGGTSTASPLWAALLAVIDQGLCSPLGLINPSLYGAGAGAAAPFHDITVGTNAYRPASGGRYPATAGYDMATGWGSPAGLQLLSDLATSPTCPVVTGVTPSAGPVAGGGTITIAGSDLSDATSVRFGSTASSFRVVSSTSITAVVPAGPAGGGTVDVSVSNANGTSVAVSDDQYSYVAPGYWLVASDGGIFAYGDAGFYGSAGSLTLNRPVVGISPTPDGRGYWLVASDGGIFAYGDAAFYGSAGSLTLNRPVVGISPTPDGRGYWLVASDGGIFAYGDAGFYGSAGSLTLNRRVVGMAAA